MRPCHTLQTGALFHCKCHLFIRQRNNSLLIKYNSTSELLHPNTVEEVSTIAAYLREIEENMTHLKMC